MRRGLTAAVGTVLGTVLLIGAKLGHAADEAAGANTAAEQAAAPTASPMPAPKTPGPTITPKGLPSAKPSVAMSATPPTSKATTKPKPSGLQDGTFTGPAVSERYGTIKVTIAVSGGRISSADGSCSCSGRSLSISDSAFSKLEPRVLTAQSATVQSVSGATYTSDAYKESLAAAIDDAKA